MEKIFMSLAESGLLPWAALVTVVLLGSIVMLLGSARRTRSASVRLRDLEALREGVHRPSDTERVR